MCGITGVWFNQAHSREVLAHHASAMAARLRHRGPDDSGVFADPVMGLALGHRRLSVIDLSAHGHQPMKSASGRYVVTYNGELFNYQSLRSDLQANGHAFNGQSDTEVLLAAIEQWGINDALIRLNGMFAFALWDCKQQCLVLARDRIGIKPLYFGWTKAAFAFGSELKAFTALPGFENSIDRDSLSLLLRHGYIPTPYSIYKNIYKLIPGSSLCIDSKMARSPIRANALAARCVAYWSARDIAERGEKDLLHLTDAEAVDRLDLLLRESVASQMTADVPIGAFLSGGVDSSTVAAIMQATSHRPIKTFSIGFREAGFDEAPFALGVSNYLRTDHEELYLSADDALAVVPHLHEICDEPFADSSVIPSYLVSKLARGSVTVALSGDGGDELFGGYGRYLEAKRYGQLLKPVPYSLRRCLARFLGSPAGPGAHLVRRLARFLPPGVRPQNPNDAARILAELLSARSDDDLYASLTTHWNDASRIAKGAAAASIGGSDGRTSISDSLARMMLSDLLTYLPDDCLAKVDRASMAVGLETRVPLLDNHVVKFALQISTRQKIRQKEGKWILRRVLERYLPTRLTDRPKMGFAVPIGDWLRGPLREWAETLLEEKRLNDEGYFLSEPIRKMWVAHTSGMINAPYHLWIILMFQAWLEQQAIPIVSADQQ